MATASMPQDWNYGQTVWAMQALSYKFEGFLSAMA